jgi:hypothetical protein
MNKNELKSATDLLIGSFARLTFPKSDKSRFTRLGCLSKGHGGRGTNNTAD